MQNYIDVVKKVFKKKFGSNPEIFFSPGRINIIGEHTDYNLGLAMPASINKGLYFAIRLNQTNRINYYTDMSSKISSIDVTNLEGNSVDDIYFYSFLMVAQEKNLELKGMDIVIVSSLDSGAGLSSSAALCCGFFYAFSKILNWNLRKEEIALLAQKTEHNIGLKCGLLDQYGVLFGKKDCAIFLDFKHLSFKEISVFVPNYSWVILNSGIKHQLAVDSEYNQRKDSCARIVRYFKRKDKEIKSLRDINFELFLKHQSAFDRDDFEKAKFIFQENNRVVKMKKALIHKDALEVGKLLNESHRGLSSQYQVSLKEMDFLVDLLHHNSCVVGCRMIGGGFGGAVLALVKSEGMDKLAPTLDEYFRTTSYKCSHFEVHLVNGLCQL